MSGWSPWPVHLPTGHGDDEDDGVQRAMTRLLCTPLKVLLFCDWNPTKNSSHVMCMYGVYVYERSELDEEHGRVLRGANTAITAICARHCNLFVSPCFFPPFFFTAINFLFLLDNFRCTPHCLCVYVYACMGLLAC